MHPCSPALQNNFVWSSSQNHARVLQVLQNLEAAVGQVNEAPNSSRGVLVSRIAAAEAAGVSNPLVRTANVQVRTRALSEAHAGMQSALKHLHSKVPITVQLSSLRSALERAEEALLETQTQDYLSIAHCREDLPRLLMFSAGESTAQEAAGSATSSTEPGSRFEDDGDGEDAERSATSTAAPKQEVDSTSWVPVCPSTSSVGSDSTYTRTTVRQIAPSCTSSAAGDGKLLSEEAARRKACASGYAQLREIDEDVARQLVDGIDAGLLKALCESAETLVVSVGRALAGIQSLEAHLRQIEAGKAESVRSCPFSVHRTYCCFYVHKQRTLVGCLWHRKVYHAFGGVVLDVYVTRRACMALFGIFE
jgi:hypothetical protein